MLEPYIWMAQKTKSKPYGTQSLAGVTIVTSFKKKSDGKWQTATYAGNYFPITRRLSTQSSIQYQTGIGGFFRPCTHDTLSYLTLPVSDSMPAYWDSSPFGGSNAAAIGVQVTGYPRYVHQRYYGNFLTAVAGVSTPVDSIQWAALSQVALEKMLPSLGGDNSLINFVLELKDFRRIANILVNGVKSKLEPLFAIAGFNPRDHSFKKLSKSYLSYQFGWRPLFNDIVSIVETLSGLVAKYNLLRAEANTDLQKHFSTLVTGTSVSQQTLYDSGIQFPPGYSTEYSGFTIRSRVIADASDGVQYNATLRYRYPMPAAMTGPGGKAKAFLDSLGVAGNPAHLWNAIPFTFLVDWVVNVGSWLNRLRIDNIQFQTEIREFCHSAVFTRNVRMETQIRTGFSTSNNTHVYLREEWATTDQVRKRRYVRRIGIPNFLTAMQTSGLNWREFSLGGALVGANARWKRRR